MRTLEIIEHTVWTFGVHYLERMRQTFIGLKIILRNIYKKAHRNSLYMTKGGHLGFICKVKTDVLLL